MKRIVLSLSAVIVLTGCSGKLTRSKAQATLDEQIQPSKKLVDYYSPDFIVQVGTVSGDCSINDKMYDPVEADSLHTYSLLKETGMLTIQSTGYPRTHSVALTEAGKQNLGASGLYGHRQKAHCDQWQADLLAAKFDRVIITGIVQDGVHAKAEVGVCWKLTALGKAIKALNLTEKDYSSVVSNLHYYNEKGEYCEPKSIPFEKFDDGWRPAGKLF